MTVVAVEFGCAAPGKRRSQLFIDIDATEPVSLVLRVPVALKVVVEC